MVVTLGVFGINMKIPDFETLEEAKQYLRDRLEEGANCPCCTQFVKQWKHSVNASIASTLIKLYNLGKEKEWVHVPTEINPKNGGMFSIAQVWDLIEPKLNDDTSKRSSGLWRLTKKGEDFVLNKIKIQKYAHIYEGKAYKFDGGVFSIQDALGKKFNYEELLNGTL